MKILMLITELGYGGAERAFLGLAAELAKRHEVEIVLYQRHYATGTYAQEEQPVALPIHFLDERGGSGRIARWRRRLTRLRMIKDAFRPDVTVSFLTGPNLLNVLTRRRDKVVVSVRGTRRYDLSQPACSRWAYVSTIDPLIVRRSDLVVSVSESLTREISGARGINIPAKFKTVSGYVNAAKLVGTACTPVETEVEALAQFPLIVGAGRIAPDKGFQHLIARFAAVKRSEPNAKLLLVGDGPAMKMLVEQACGLNLLVADGIADELSQFDVIFLGFRPDPYRYYRLGRVFVLASMTDGFPNTLAEALATGVPILAVDAPWGAREVLGLPADPLNRPFATLVPEETGLGTLMPRMDRPEFARMWEEVLLDRLHNDRRSVDQTSRQLDRLRQLDASQAATKWEALLLKMVGNE
ncbi:glycosyltransferase [Sphingomonas sp. RB1R13]|uniref:glycosyltransferase n=1 Tax=Sphingomonas sp. RB1R13 TaxID=3096159 RepID=UPI002FC875C0